MNRTKTTRAFAAILLAVPLCSIASAYEYDASDPAQGAGMQAPWRSYAKWDTVDELSTKEIHQFTTEARYITPMVSYVPEDPTVPSPRDVLGHIAGAEGILTHPDEEARYFRALDEASPRVTVQVMGHTEEGREILLAIVTSEENMARLEEFKGYSRRLADPRGVSAEEAMEISQKCKPIMHITAGLHSPETGSPEMVMELAYRVAVSDHPDIVQMRDNVVLLITPVIEVDGRARVVEWNRRFLEKYDDLRYMPSYSPPYWGEHAFHDNNRDGIQMTLKLTQHYLESFNEWHPVYSLDLHESVPLMYVSGGTGPYNPTIDPITEREWQLAAHWELEELQRYNLPGVWTWGFYDGWNPSYLLWVTNNRNSMGRFYETFGNSVAATMERDLSEATYAKTKVTEPMWYNADPPDKKVNWSLRNNTNYMQSGVLASLKFTARNGDMLLHNFWQKGINSIERGKKEAPYAFVIPKEQRDQARLEYLLTQLDRHGIEIHRATEAFKLEDGDFDAGDYIVRCDQPYGNFARNLLEHRDFPKEAEHRPYDDVAWSLGLHYGVDVWPIKDKTVLDLAAIERAHAPFPIERGVDEGKAAAYAIANTGNYRLITARYMLKGVTVLAAEEVFEAGGVKYPRGSWILPNKGGLRHGELQAAAERCVLRIHSLEAMPKVPTHSLDPPKLALYHTWVSTQPDGWARYTLEQFGVPYTYINDDDVRRGGLRSRFDVIIVADQGGVSARSMVQGRDTKFGPMPYTTAREFPSQGVIDSANDITGGFGFEGAENLQHFLNSGGTLLMFGSSGKLATDLGLLRNVTSAMGVDTPGSFLQAKVLREDHPIVYGYETIDHVFRGNGPYYTVPKEYDHWIVQTYGTKEPRDDEDDAKTDGEKKTEEATDDDAKKDEAKSDDATSKPKEGEKKKPKKDTKKFLLGGFIDKQSALEKQAAILDVPRNAGGRVVLYSFNPLHRYLNHHDFNYAFNAILNWNDFPDPKPKDHPQLVKD